MKGGGGEARGTQLQEVSRVIREFSEACRSRGASALHDPEITSFLLFFTFYFALVLIALFLVWFIFLCFGSYLSLLCNVPSGIFFSRPGDILVFCFMIWRYVILFVFLVSLFCCLLFSLFVFVLVVCFYSSSVCSFILGFSLPLSFQCSYVLIFE